MKNHTRNYIYPAYCLLITPFILLSPAYGKDFTLGKNDDVTLRLNAQFSVGASARMQDPDPDYIGESNGGKGGPSTTDDGTQNFEKYDVFTSPVKGIVELDISKDNYGFFTRGKAWYDYALDQKDVLHGNSLNGYETNDPLEDNGFSQLAKFKGAILLDAYLYGDFDIGDIPVSLKLGRHVLSWGESTFIQNGLNIINPFDVSAFRRPGAEIKEGLLPIGMFSVNAGLTEKLSLEAFYQFEWEKTTIDGCGTYFSTADFVAEGCNVVSIRTRNDQESLKQGEFITRTSDDKPDDLGQYGISARYFSDLFNGTEFGFYFMNLHSRLPLIAGLRTSNPNPLLPFEGDITRPDWALNPKYFIAYPEDLKIYGLSFSTTIGGVAFSGEISYKPDTPIQINGAEILNAAVTENDVFRLTPRIKAVGLGERVNGFDEFDVTQIQFTGIKFIDNVMAASRLVLVGEVGVVLTDGIGIDETGQRYGRNTVFGLGDFQSPANPIVDCAFLTGAITAINGDCRSDGFVTASAWGYRLLARLQYPSLFLGMSVNPSLAWSHDVNGYSPEPAQQFQEGRKAISLTVPFEYQSKYSLSLGYTVFYGGNYNVQTDKDFASISFSLSL